MSPTAEWLYRRFWLETLHMASNDCLTPSILHGTNRAHQRHRDMRVIASIALLAVATTGCIGESSGGATGLHRRITQAQLAKAVSKAKGATTYCSRHTADGSRWACLAGDGMDPECFVILVGPDGHWREQDQPPVCQYP